MRNRLKFAFALLASSALYPAFAQDTLRTDVIDVVKSFKPVLSEAMKIPSNPNPEIPEVKVPVFDYRDLPEEKHSTSPTIYTIRPLVMGTALLPRLRSNYTKLGYGNYNTPLLEVYLNTTTNKELQAGLFAKHLSSNPSGNNTFSNNVLYGFAKKFSPTGVLAADAWYYRNGVNLYGFNEQLIPAPTPDQIRQLFQTFDIRASYANIAKDSNATGYRLGVGYYRFFDNHQVAENDFRLSADFSKRLQGNPLEVTTALNITSITAPALTYQRVFIDIMPRYTLHTGSLYLKPGFNATVFSDSSQTKMYFFPFAEAGLSVIPGSLTAFSGITGNVQRNTYRSIAGENPFIVRPEFRNTVNNFEIYGGLKGSLGAQTSFLVQAGWANMQNLLFYAVDTLLYNGQVAHYYTADAGVTNVKAELTHEFDAKFRFGFAFNWYSYDLAVWKPYSRPTLTTKLNAMYNLGEKFIFRADVFTMNERTALLLQPNTEQKVDGLVDLNLGLDYIYNKNVSLFLNLNNITNNTYQRWYSYPVYGFNMLAGITIGF